MNKVPYALITLLSDGEFHSGEAIGERFGISRSAIWKQLKKLADLGIEIESIKGKGYRVVTPFQVLSESVIRYALKAVAPSATLDFFVTIDSTNLEMSRRIFRQDAVVKGDLIVSEQQTEGKGRRGRSWLSPFASNIYLSMAWYFDQAVQKLDGLSLVVGLAVAETLAAFSTQGVAVKWPNDVMIDDKKVAGILLEINGDPTAECHVVMGVGINVNMTDEGDTVINQPWTSLAQSTGAKVDRNELFPILLKNLVSFVGQFEREGFQGFQSQWAGFDWLKDKPVVVKMGNNTAFGMSRGVDDEGALLVEDNGKVTRFSGGEVSIRRHHA